MQLRPFLLLAIFALLVIVWSPRANADDFIQCNNFSDLQRRAGLHDAAAQYELATLYFAGECTTKDIETGAKWLHRSVTLGNTRAQSLYAYMLDKEGHIQEAAVTATLAAQKGDSDSQALLAYIYSEGKGVPVDNIQAVHWARLAAKSKSYLGQLVLGSLYSEGKGGLPKDLVEADKWYILASQTTGRHLALQEIRVKLEAQMIAADITLAEQRASSWQSENRANAPRH